MTIEVYSFGPCHLSTCSDETVEQITESINSSHPTGVSTPWTHSPKHFKTGETNPTPCLDTEDRQHHLFECKSTLDAMNSLIEKLA